MSSEPPPEPISNSFNVSQWNINTFTQAQADTRYISKLFDSVANGIISFVLGLKTNRITFYSGTTITIGTVDSTATNIYKPILSSTAPANNANNTSIISTAWVNSFWTYVRTQAYSWSGIQTFTEISSSTTTLGNLTINNTGTFTLNKPISPGYNPSEIISGQIGSQQTAVFVSPLTLSATVVTNIATYTLPIGVYFIQANIVTPTPVTYQGLGISSIGGTIQYECWSNILTDNFIYFALNVSRIVVITTASTPIYIIAQAGDTRTLIDAKTQCFRIA